MRPRCGTGHDMEKDLKETPDSQPKSDVIKVAGKEFSSVADLVKAYESASKVIGEQGRKMGEMKKGLVKELATDTADDGSIETDLFDKPAEVFQKFKKNIKHELREELKAESAEEDVWNGFFAKNKALEPLADKIKHDTYTRLWPQIADKTADEQLEAIAKEWNPFIKASTSANDDASYEDIDPSTSRTAASRDDTSGKGEPSDTPSTLTGMLKKRFGK